jgi:[ribosomal protein S18]-alanine N-acetyltransferase
VRYVVERMTMADIPRVVEIERLAYPSTWPPSAYRKELQDNPLAHYIVVRDTHIQALPALSSPADSGKRPFPLSLLPGRSLTSSSPQLASIIGFSGLWLMVDEAHVTTIATHPGYRGRGVGELLLSSLIEIAYRIGARNMTLEVRVSNYVAQNLYRKYGFAEAGVRRRYYSDNHEDAYIMWTEDINSERYRSRFTQLKAALTAKLAAQDSEPSASREAGG